MLHGATIADARRLAVFAHGEQRYGELTYVEGHLALVARELWGRGNDPSVVAAGWLHDALEDTLLTGDDVELVCGPTVRRLVEACTGVGRSRRERQADILEKLRRCPGALAVKLADRLVNVRSAREHRPDLLRMYLREHAAFREGLFDLNRGCVEEELWRDLDASVAREGG